MSDNAPEPDKIPGELKPEVTAERRRQMAAEMYASGATIQEIGLAVETAERHVYRLLDSPTARKTIAEIRSATVGAIAGKRVLKLHTLFKRLDKLTVSSDERVALSATRYAIEVGLALHGLEHLEGRMREVEGRLGISPQSAEASVA